MLSIFYGDMKGVVYNTSVYFKNMYEEDWITDELAVEMILDVDQSKVLAGGVIDSPVMGMIPPISLSGGVKTLILIHNMPEKIFNASTCGDNCAKWILRMADERDITINLRHLMDFGPDEFEIRRNITIIRGDSATGKTTLIDMIREYDENGEDSEKHASWERFFTTILTERTENTYLRYNKKNLNPVYLHDNIKNKILNIVYQIQFS